MSCRDLGSRVLGCGGLKGAEFHGVFHRFSSIFMDFHGFSSMFETFLDFAGLSEPILATLPRGAIL